MSSYFTCIGAAVNEPRRKGGRQHAACLCNFIIASSKTCIPLLTYVYMPSSRDGEI